MEKITDVIDAYFETFYDLLLPLYDMVSKYHYAMDKCNIDLAEEGGVCSDLLADKSDLFTISANDVINRISIEPETIHAGIGKNITIKYNNLKTRYIDFKNEFDKLNCMQKPFKITNVRVNNGTGIFYHVFKDFFNKQTTLNDYYNKILQELEAGYNAIMVFFTDTEPKIPAEKIVVPDYVLNWLQETKCSNGNGFIENATAKPKWLQNRQNARVLLTHKAIKGSLSDAEVERQTPTIFIDKKGKPLNLANNDKRQENTDTDKLKTFLDNLKKNTTG